MKDKILYYVLAFIAVIFGWELEVTPDEPTRLDTRMSNEEWADAVLAEIVRNHGKEN